LPTDQGVWRGTTAEERVAPRRRKLVQAGFELLGEHGTAGTTVRGVCARAGLSHRYFYESFADLDELMAAVFDEIVGEATRRTLEAIAAAPEKAEAKTRAALDASIRFMASDARRIRIMVGEGNTGVLVARRSEMVRLTAGLMADQAARFYGIPRDDKLLASTTLMLTGGLFELCVAWSKGRVDLTVDELIEHATLLVVGTSQASGRLAGRSRRPKAS
jgi:AcrR family transcriptional regulator